MALSEVLSHLRQRFMVSGVVLLLLFPVAGCWKGTPDCPSGDCNISITTTTTSR